jgi:hypothetical protein
MRAFIRRYGDRLLPHDTGRVVIIGDRSSDDTVAAWEQVAPGRVEVVHLVRGEPSARVDAETATSREVTSARAASRVCESWSQIVVLVDATESTASERVELWEWLFFHVADQGHYVGSSSEPEPAWVTSLELTGMKHKSDRELSELRASLGRERFSSDGFIAMPKTSGHLFKVREDRADPLLASRLDGVAVETIGHLPEGTTESSLRVVQHGLEQSLPPTRFSYPAADIRWISGTVTMGDSMLALRGSTIFPSSFRHPWVDNVTNESLRNINWEFALAGLREPSVPLTGTYFDLTPSIPGHFGHIMTESVAKLWGWQAAKKRIPDLRAFCRVPEGDYVPSVEKALFTAHGIAESDIEFGCRDVVVDGFVSSTLLWQNNSPYLFHPHIRETWAGLRSALAPTSEGAPERLFVSRRLSETNRLCRNSDAVEAVFEAHGFTIVHPETMPFLEQAQTFASARVVAGFAGSGMFNVLFSERVENLIVLSHDSYRARNELLYAMSVAENLDYFWSAADRRHPGRFSTDAFHSAWEFDFPRLGGELTDLLAGLE